MPVGAYGLRAVGMATATLVACSVPVADRDAGHHDAFVTRDAWRAHDDASLPRPPIDAWSGVPPIVPGRTRLELVSPMDDGVLGPATQVLAIRGGIDPIIDVCTDATCLTHLFTRPTTSGQLEISPPLAPGTYAWRARDGSGMTAFRSFHVATARVVASNTRSTFDVDGDGRADVVGCVYDARAPYVGTLYVWRGADLMTPQRVGVGAYDGACLHPRDAGDLDGDGASDVVEQDGSVARRGAMHAPLATRLAVRAQRDATFATTAIGDVDHDGLGDLAVVYIASSPTWMANVAVLFGDGASVGTRQTALGVGDDHDAIDLERGLAPLGADLDGDGMLDVAAASRTSMFVYSTGHASAPLARFDAPDGPDSYFAYDVVAAGDVDGDGIPEIAVVQLAPPGIRFASADGRISPLIDCGVDARSQIVALGDFDRDGLDDLAIAGVRDVSILFGGPGSPRLTVATGGDPSTGDIEVAGPGDVNGDGARDLVLARPALGEIAVILGGSRDVPIIVHVLAVPASEVMLVSR